jgi:hypothetical protein
MVTKKDVLIDPSEKLWNYDDLLFNNYEKTTSTEQYIKNLVQFAKGFRLDELRKVDTISSVYGSDRGRLVTALVDIINTDFSKEAIDKLKITQYVPPDLKYDYLDNSIEINLKKLDLNILLELGRLDRRYPINLLMTLKENILL